MSAEATVLRPEREPDVLYPEWKPDMWRGAEPGRRCRMLTGGRGCGAPALLELLRRGKKRPTWWPYCGDHAHGRVVLDDGVYHAYEPLPEALAALFGEEVR